MARVSETYPTAGNFLKAETVKEKKLVGKKLTIAGVEKITLQEKDKLVLSFKDIEDKLVLNSTNANILSEAFGDESDDWTGKTIELTLVKVRFQGSLVPSVQVKA